MTKSMVDRGSGDRGDDHGHDDGHDGGHEGHCGWCRRVLPPKHGPGRPRRFCSQRCRQWNWVAAQRNAELALTEHDLVIARDELDRLHDDLYVLACAIDDVERDLSSSTRPTTRSLTDHLTWLLEAAHPLKDRTIHPS